MAYQQSYNQSNNLNFGGGNGGYNNTQQPPLLPGGNQARPNIGGNYMNNGMGGNNTMSNNNSGYQDPFTGSQQNWNNQSQFGNNSNGFQNMTNGAGNTGYQQPFNVSNMPSLPGMQHNNRPPTMYDQNNNPRVGDNLPPQFLQFQDLTSAQMTFIRQIETFIISNNLQLDTLLQGPPIHHSPLESTLTSKQFESLGRYCRVDILDYEPMRDLELKLRDPANPQTDKISLTVLKRLLSQSGAVMITHQTEENGEILEYELQQLRDLMTSHNKKTAIELFEGESMATEGDDKCVSKEVFVRKALEAAMNAEEIEKTFSNIVTMSGKASLKKLQEELQKKATQIKIPDSMTEEKAQQVLSEIFQQLKHFIAFNEVNIFDLFDDIEQGDGYFSRDEFTTALAKCNFKIVGGTEHEDRILAVFMIYDKQRTRRFDYQQFLYDFYQRANEKKKINPAGERFFNVYEHTRQYLKGKKQLSLASTFLSDYQLNDMPNLPNLRELIKQNQEIPYETENFLHILNRQVGCKELDSRTSQTFIPQISYQGKFDKVDYIKFCDFVGYEQPAKSDKEHARKIFYKFFLKDLQGNLKLLQQEFRKEDTILSGRCHVSNFINIIIRFSQTLQNYQEEIRQIANEFMIPGEIMQVDYLLFISRIEQELNKLNAIRRVYISFNQILQFQDSTDLYKTLFKNYDTQSGEKKFSSEQLKKLFMEQLGISAEPADQDAKYFLQEFDQGHQKTFFVRFADIEPDFREYINNEKSQGRIRSLTGINAILQAIKSFSDLTGQNLRQIFGKTKFEESDQINHYQMTKIMNMISQKTRQPMDDTSIQLFNNQISTAVNQPQGGGSPGKKDKLDSGNTRQISFLKLQELYNQKFDIKDKDQENFAAFQVQNLQTHISKVVLEMTRVPNSKFNLREIFAIPQSLLKDFIATLNAEPFVCSKDHSISTLEQLAKKYECGFERVNTHAFIMDLENSGKQLKDKDFIYSELRKNILKKNSTIEKVFEEAISDIKRFKMELFKPEEFYLVFIYLEIKSVTLQQLKDVLANSQEADEGKYSVPDFIKDFKLLNNTDPAAARKGRKFYNTREDIIKRIVFVIEHRNIQNFGQLLADQVLEGKNSISRDLFYRLIDSFKFGLGEADIQELMRGYTDKNFLINIEKFRDDLNAQIVDPQNKVQLQSKLTDLLKTRVVDPIEEKEIKQVKIDPKLQAQFQSAAREIICGLFVLGKNAQSWFITFGTYQKSALTNQEFIKGIQQLEAKVDSSFAQAYYENLVQRQSQQLGYTSEKVLLIDQLELLLSRDCNLSSSPSKMIDEILLDIAFHLTDNKIPLGDKIRQFDPTNQGTISRTDFTSNFLDNYLQLQNILSTNEKKLLANKYAPNPSTLMFRYESFIADLRKKQDENRGGVHIYMTQQEVDLDDTFVKEEPVESSLEQEQPSQFVAEVVSMPALSKRNTHVTELTAKKPSLKAGIQIGSFLFDDIMMYSFQRGKSVEEFFSQFAKISSGDLVMNKEDFGRGITLLGVEWSTNVRRVSDIFDQLDIAANRGTSLKFITVTDLAEAVLFNAGIYVDDKLSEYLFSVYRVLNEGKKESKLQDLFNFINTNRDETCLNTEFKKIILDLVDPQRSFKVINEHQFEQLINRYRVTNTVPEFRVNFEKFHRDIQYASKGISIGMIWAIELASNIMKVKQITEQQNYDQIFNKYSRMSGALMFEEFRKCMYDMKLNEYHKDQEFQDFFNNAAQGSTTGNVQINTNKVAISQLKDMLTKLAPPNAGVLIQQIVQVIWTETKKNNKSLQTVMTSFTEFDQQKQGTVTYQNFKNVLISRLNVTNLIELDFQILAKRYMVRTTSTNQDIENQMIQFNMFIQDYQAFEKMGLKVVFDPLKQTQQAPATNQTSSPLDAKAKPLTKQSQDFYKQMQDYFVKNKAVDLLCDALGKLDSAAHRGTLPEEQLRKVFAHFKVNLNDNSMNNLLQPLPVDQLDQSYSYVVLIELAFGKQKAVDTYNKYRMGMTAQASQQGKPLTQAVMSQRFKDDIEVKLTLLLNWVHQISKGSYILTQQQFLAVFEPVGILVTAPDRDLLTQTFQMLKQQQTQTVNFNTFVTHFAISDVTAGVIAGLQKVIAEQNIRVSDEDTGSTLFNKEMVSLEDFNKFLETQKIEIPGFTPRQINDAFAQMSERKGAIEKNRLIRILKNEREFVKVNAVAAQPFIVSEFINHIVNNKVNLFSFITAKSQSLIIAHFNELIKKIKYVPSNPKDLPQLIKHFADQEPQNNAEPKSVSIGKILAEIRKKDPQYALETTIINQAANTLGVKLASNPVQQQAAQKLTPQQVAQGQVSSFTQRVKDILLKINEQLKRSGLSNSQLFSKIDINGTSTIEKEEFIQFFQKDLIVKGLTLDEIHLAFDSFDMNRDGVLSINEFCLLLEGAQHNFEQKLRQFDPELEKTLKDEVNTLFDFFDTNKDNTITQQELEAALKSQNPHVTLNETLTIMKLADRDMNKQIDRKEFTEIMLPMLKAEVINRDQNLDDLRRLFKEFDLDGSNYLTKQEFREALVRLDVILSDVQVDDLLKEIDLDQNNVMDIDEFIAFLAIADQVRFSNPANKAILIKIKHARKLQPIDFYNCFKNLPQSFQTSILTQPMEKCNKHTPSYGLYPQFDGKTMNYRELQKLEEFGKVPAKKFIELFSPQLGSEITIEEATGVPLPKKEDFDWGKIINREVRVVLVDAKNQDLLSNVFMSQAAWKQDAPSKWTFNATEIQNSGRQFVIRTDSMKTEPNREVHLVFELILYTKLSDGVQTQQVCCAWGSIPLNQLDKQAKIKISLKGGRVLQEIKISQDQIHQEKKGFEFLRKLTASSDEPLLTLSVKPFIKLTEQQQLHLSMLPNNVLVNRKLLSFTAYFRLLAFRRLTKSQQQMLAPAGNFAIAQFRKLFDSPDVNLLLADCWEHYESTAPKGQFTVDEYLVALEEFLVKTYAIIYQEGFHFDHVYPTRGANSVESELFSQRESMIKQQLAPQKYKKIMNKTLAIAVVNKENNMNANNDQVFEDYKPFNIAEMEIPIVGVVDSVEAKQDELTKMYQQMGLLNV